jgi:1,2-dihydroxy-3-keto-5-methylthiopentene dioxygenase
MSRLSIFPECSDAARSLPPLPLLVSDDPAIIQTELQRRGIRFEQWPAPLNLLPGAAETEILTAYGDAIARLQQESGCRTVDAMRIAPDHPEREARRQRFLAEHRHDNDEVRFFVEGQGLFCFHIDQEVLLTLCVRGDLISVPAGTRHWFDMGAKPAFCVLRFFSDNAGWVPRYTGDPIASRFPGLD